MTKNMKLLDLTIRNTIRNTTRYIYLLLDLSLRILKKTHLILSLHSYLNEDHVSHLILSSYFILSHLSEGILISLRSVCESYLSLMFIYRFRILTSIFVSILISLILRVVFILNFLNILIKCISSYLIKAKVTSCCSAHLLHTS